MGATEGFKMFKLTELLRDYLRKEYPYSEYGVYLSKDKNLILEKSHSFMGYGIDEEWYEDVDFGDSILISKSFGFIQRLVENDKIDIEKVYKNLTNYEIEIRIRAVKELLENNEEDTIAYLKLLMLLAIQDEPISFLCEIIKNG